MRFPYPLRRYQRETLELMRQAAAGGHLVLQAGTGSGKTVCAVYATLSEALSRDKVVLYLVRTNSQQQQVMLELRRLGRSGIALQGRQRMCLLVHEDPHLAQGTPDELSQFCRDRKEAVLEGEEGCPHYRALLEDALEDARRWVGGNLPTAEEMVDHCSVLGICPYELNKLLLPDVSLVTAPYVYFFEPPLRRALLEGLNRPIEDIILIVDEAHNLPDYCRDVASFSISQRSIELAEREVMDHSDPEVADGVSLFDFLEALGAGLRQLVTDYVVDEDGPLPPSALEVALMETFTATTRELRAMIASMAALGEVVRESKRRRGELPRSHVLSLSRNLLRWMTLEEVECAKLVKGGENPALVAYCLDPSIAAHPILDCHASIHMSGTLHPLMEYRDSIGLPPDTIMKAFPSPFPRENRRIVYLDWVTTRYADLTADPEAVGRLRHEVRRLLRACRRNTLFLFPSYDLLDAFLDLRRECAVPVYAERRGMPQGELMRALDAFRSPPSALFAVAGGRVAEGLDFPSRELEIVVIVGIPYPKPTAALRALVNYYDWKFQRGWEYGVVAPTTRRLLQCAGRLIRSEKDRGVVIILDRRAAYFKGALGPVERVEDPLRVIEEHLALEAVIPRSQRSPENDH